MLKSCSQDILRSKQELTKPVMVPPSKASISIKSEIKYISLLEKQEKKQSFWAFLIEASVSKMMGKWAQQAPAFSDHCKHMAGLLFWFLNLDLELKMKSCVLQWVLASDVTV